jgi:hypothetical protein
MVFGSFRGFAWQLSLRLPPNLRQVQSVQHTAGCGMMVNVGCKQRLRGISVHAALHIHSCIYICMQ